MAEDIRTFSGDFEELERAIVTGYIDKNVGMFIQKFSTFDLTNGQLSLGASFNNLNPFLDTPTELYVSSSSANDAGKTVLIFYIDQNRAMDQVEVTLQGQTAVSLGANIYCVWRMYNSNGSDYEGTISVGSEAAPAGGVPVAANTYCNIPIIIGGITPVNQSLTGVFSVPAGWTGFITVADTGAEKGADMRASSLVREENGVFRYTETLSVFQSARTKRLFNRVPEKADIKPVAIAQTGGICYIDYSIMLIKNEYVDRYLR